MFSSRIARFAAAGAATVAVAVGGLAIGNASSPTSSSGTATAAQAAAPATTAKAPTKAPATGKIPAGWHSGAGTIITGTAADKAKAAAIAAGYKGTVNRVMKLSDGSYAVHFFANPAGPHHVFVSKSFKVTGAA
jgi:hypothetical protein